MSVDQTGTVATGVTPPWNARQLASSSCRSWLTRAGETPIYGPDGKYQGSVFDYGKMQTYTDRSGHFTGSAINNGNGTTSFFGRNGNFTGSAGSSSDQALNFGRGR